MATTCISHRSSSSRGVSSSSSCTPDPAMPICARVERAAESSTALCWQAGRAEPGGSPAAAAAAAGAVAGRAEAERAEEGRS